MNYIELINNFWKVHKEYNFSPIEISLYFYLLDASNSLGWKNPFNQANTFIVGILGISEKTLYSSRKTLEEAGLIEFESGNGRRYKSSYFLKGCNRYNLSGTLSEEGLPKGLQKGSNKNNLSGGTAPANNKLNKTKPNNKLNIGETNVSQRVTQDLFIEGFKDNCKDSGISTPFEGEKPLEPRFEANKPFINTKEKVQFKKPTLEEVTAYCNERGNDVNPQSWLDYYASNGWKVGRNSMKDWKAAVRTWERNGITNNNSNKKDGREAGYITKVPGKSLKDSEYKDSF